MRNTRYLLLGLFLSLLPFFPCWATNVKYYTISEGMAINAVYSIMQDTKGKMWFGTRDGLHSFDGNRIQVWRDSHVSTLSPCIYTLMEDSLLLYVGSDAGLSVFNLQTESFSPFDIRTHAGMSIHSPVRHVMKDSRNNIWICTFGQGVFRYDLSAKVLYQYAAIGTVTSDYTYRILEDSSGMIWLATHDAGVARYIPSADMFQSIAGNTEMCIRTVFEDSQHNIWFGSGGNGLFLWDKNQDGLVQKVKPVSPTQLLQVRKIVEWNPGFLLFASDEGLTEYDTKTGKVVSVTVGNRQHEGLNDNYLHELFIDREHSLWIGTYFGGVNYLPSTRGNYKHYNEGNSQLEARIVSVFAKADGDNVWIGTDDAGFFYWNRSDGTFTSYRPQAGKSSPAYHNVHALMQDGDKLYIGMYMGGLDILDLKTGRFKNYKAADSPNSLYSSEIYAVYKDIEGQIWIGTTRGLNKYDPVADAFDRVYELQGADIQYILDDTKGYLWVCSLNKGVFRFNRRNARWEHFDEENHKIPTNMVITACQDMEGRLWFGTNGNGLMRYDYGKDCFEEVNVSENLRVVNRIISENGRLWLTTNNGIYCWKSEERAAQFYNKYDGLQENLFLPNAGIQLADGTILVGGINGFNEFHPSKIQRNTQPPTVILTDFRLFNKPVKIGDEDSPLDVSITYADRLVLRHEHSVFSFSAVTLSYTNASKNRYRYKLEGFEEEWVETDYPPHPTYTNLPAGDYLFKVASSNSDGVWNEKAIMFPIRVLPPWWCSTPMWVVYCLVLAGCMGYVFGWINRRHHRRIALLTMEKDKEIYQSKIEFFTHVMHEIRTPLTLILAPLENVMRMEGSIKDALPKLQVIQRNGNRLLALVNQLMDFRKIESGGMDLVLMNTDVKSLLGNICQRFELSAEMKNIQFTVEMPEYACYAKVDPEALTKIVSNLLSNALKFTNNCIEVSLAVNAENKVEIRVKDNGTGIRAEEQEKIFKPFYQIAGNRQKDCIGTGVGLSLVKQLVDMMHGHLTLESELGKGAMFCVCLDAVESLEQADSTKKQPVADAPVCEVTQAEDGKRHILVVDDNKDLREYLKSLLASSYQITCAADGKEAWDALPRLMPDLIISDVMMPVMDGIQLCQSIKGNLAFSHIPIILLTAKATSADYVEGLENGADVYIEKPFSGDVLKAQISSLFRNRERLRKDFESQPMASPVSVSTSKLDAAFMEKISRIIEDRMTDSSFTVDVLAQEVGISRSGLFTKLKAIAGMTPNDYIRLLRLKKAAMLLSVEGLSSSEACFQVGFSSPSYFAKCFHAQFGISPAEFKRK